MHVIFVPYAIMKTDPASWLKMVTRFKGKHTHTHRFNSLFPGKPGLAGSSWFSVSIRPSPRRLHGTCLNCSYLLRHNPIPPALPRTSPPLSSLSLHHHSSDYSHDNVTQSHCECVMWLEVYCFCPLRLCVCACICVHPETLLSRYLAVYLTHFHQTYINDAV